MKEIIKKLIPVSYWKRVRSWWDSVYLWNRIGWGKLTRLVRRPKMPDGQNGRLNLHLGCGQINHPAFINIDAVPAPHIHYIRNANNLSNFRNNTVDLIYASHCLEHFSFSEVKEVLEEWYRVLKPNGILRLSVPDLDLLLSIYMENSQDIQTIMHPLFGSQVNKFDYHKVIFNRASLTEMLRSIGLSDIRDWKPGSDPMTTFDDWSSRLITVNGKEYPVSLNIEAVK